MKTITNFYSALAFAHESFSSYRYERQGTSPAQGQVLRSAIKKILFVLSIPVLALTARADSIVFDTFGPGDTYHPTNAFLVGDFSGPLAYEEAAQFTAAASGNLTSVALGLTYYPGFTALPVNVYLYGDAGGSPDNANQILLGSATPTDLYGTTTNSVVSFAVPGTVPVTTGSTYWLVLKPTVANEADYWNSASPTVSGMEDQSSNDSTWNFAYPFLPAFRLTAASVPAYAAQIQQPINSDGSSVFSVRRGVVPVKFTLTLNGSSTCTLPPAIIGVTRTSGGTIGSIDESVYVGSADTGSNFRIDSCQYVYNLSASALGVGTYRVDILINGQVVGSGIFQLK